MLDQPRNLFALRIFVVCCLSFVIICSQSISSSMVDMWFLSYLKPYMVMLMVIIWLFFFMAEIKIKQSDDNHIYNHTLARTLVEYASAVSLIPNHIIFTLLIYLFIIHLVFVTFCSSLLCISLYCWKENLTQILSLLLTFLSQLSCSICLCVGTQILCD